MYKKINRVIEKEKGGFLMRVGICLFLATDNDNYLNELSIWAAYCIFCLAWFFSEMLAVPHAHQLKNSLYPQV